MALPRLTAPALILALATLATLGAHSPPALAAGCGGRSHCIEAPTFAAQLSDFRTSVQGANRRLIATVSFENKTDRPLIVGYVAGSGLGLDEHGNRYTVGNSSGVRGIGEIERNRFDPRFTLQPGERGDARFELGWYAANQIAGVEFQLELAVREIDAVAGDQYRLGREHLVRFAGLRDGLTAAAAAPSAAVAAQTAAAAPAATAQADPCTGLPRCHASGPFLAQVTQISPSQKGSNHFVQVRVGLRNLANQPLILAYQQKSGTLLDNYGQQYTVDWRYQQDVSGIGQVTGSKADPQFVLSPGETRMVTFTYRRYIGKSAIGTVFSPGFVVEQLEILPSKQVRSVREYAVNFTDLAGSPAGVAAAQDAGEALKQLGDGLKSIFRKKGN